METKRVKIIMLPTDKAENCILSYKELNGLEFVPGYFTKDYLNSINRIGNHLYFISDDEIKEGDWVMYLEQATENNPTKKADPYLVTDLDEVHWNDKKIIATTDKSLTKGSLLQNAKERLKTNLLPQIPKSFIEKYCEVGGIDEVLVELTGYFKCDNNHTMNTRAACRYPMCNEICNKEELKIDSHNTITIHPIKSSWNKEEVESLLFQYAEEEHGWFSSKSEIESFNNWVSKNLN